MKAKVLFLLAMLLLVASSAAQKATEPKAPTHKAAGPKYDLATEVKLKGVVDDVKQVPNSCLGETGFHLLLKTGGGVVEVQVAPVGFLKEMNIQYAKGDHLEIVGSQITVDGNSLVLARSVSRDNTDLVVRDKDGAPVWTWMKKSG